MATNIFLNANEFLYQSKLTPENLNKFKMKSCRSSNLSLASAFLKILLSTLKGFLFVFFNSQLVFKYSNSTDHRETIFLSHYFGGLPNFNDDTFFGKIPASISERHGVTIFYLLQNNSLCSFVNFKNGTSRDLQITTLPLMTRLSIFIKNTILVFEILLKSSVFSKTITRETVNNIAIEQSNLRTLRNLISIEIFLAQISSKNTKFLWFTLEGHPYERYLVSRLQRDFPDIKIFGYQHAPIVPAQSGLFKIIRDFGGTLTVCTSGSVTLKYLRSHFPDLEHNIIEIGSDKNLQSQNSSFARSRPTTILFLPEGTPDAAYSMFHFAIQVHNSLRHLKLIFRAHPRTPPSVSHEIQYNCRNNGIEFSENTLHEDFRESSITVFRSSAAAIQGLLFGNLPFFLNIDFNEGLDPLAISNLRYPIAKNVEGFHELVEEILTRPSQTSYSNQEEFFAFATNYFTPLSIPWSRLRA